MQRFIIRLFIIFAFTTFTFAENKEEMSRLTVLFTNDVHGGIVPQKAEFLNPEFPPMLGGAASAAGIIKGVRDRAEKQGFSVLLIDGGDIF
ncbi:multifunctional 2',3'-cyclic-nucleotide 2'-phosphodiesterase/5'-nucleotidase/3'-nucleotidase, partial [Candidatus Saccharibacteria bacterium]|nr:multifunctional 2',3'-cyclic-nucleotide 2'-phosphodiesterase/5'-nucleotidase/3'-nucleotidase [Candidatus Saccharibacteria bacterium]NIV72757.1 multifunctional 2',3'-cyclic-nucleotide 2'-phosphodiesterase/5'-nucleotidase/3'-nucleotidase [Calditrichia bacterium]NIV99929.1 multifunctional 2',3'-cyclic-nucleotide 2'-phosphodiesterase/5'-nucleotidase/3'-nucleotidase [Candidatus Saccharibacteria bacterium]NIW80305.1 multifunctional 2',3'-cyclic-nucleotide 2'-phosphodiesterase/5'-nucleotidase/3'-nuc